MLLRQPLGPGLTFKMVSVQKIHCLFNPNQQFGLKKLTAINSTLQLHLYHLRVTIEPAMTAGKVTHNHYFPTGPLLKSRKAELAQSSITDAMSHALFIMLMWMTMGFLETLINMFQRMLPQRKVGIQLSMLRWLPWFCFTVSYISRPSTIYHWSHVVLVMKAYSSNLDRSLTTFECAPSLLRIYLDQYCRCWAQSKFSVVTRKLVI